MNPLLPAKSVKPPVRQFIKELMNHGVPRKVAKAEYNRNDDCECYMNDLYVVLVKRDEPNGWDMPIDYLSVRRVDREPIRNWRHLQEIKNQLVGDECEGFEMYPAESRVADCANQYHLYVFKDPEIRIPIGMATGAKSDTSLCGSKNEPFGEETAS